MIDTDARVLELLDSIRDAVTAAGTDESGHLTLTSDGRDVEKAFDLSQGAIVVYPLPALEWPAPRVTKVTWTIGVVAPTSARINVLLGIVRSVLRHDCKATPTDFKLGDPAASTTIRGYIVAFTEEHY